MNSGVKQLKASIIITTFNQQQATNLVLESINYQKNIEFSDVEIIVVDDGSIFPYKPIETKAKLKLVRQSNKGRSAARNAGIKAASGPLNTVITNPDLLNVVIGSRYMPTIDVTKEENELIRLLEQPKHNFSSVAKCILQGAKVRFDCCDYDNGELTEELKDEITLVNKIDYKVMKEYIKQIVIQPDGRIITVFINNAKITNGGAENAS